MTTQLASGETTPALPTEVVMFGFPASIRAVMIGAVILCVGFSAFGVVMQLTEPSRTSWIVLLVELLVCGPAAIYCLRAYKRFRDRIAVDAVGIWYLAKSGRSTFIAWSEIADVQANDTMQRLILKDSSGSRIVRAEYQLENFSQLREFVLSHTKGAATRNSAALRLFHRSWINRVILSIFGVLMLLLAGTFYRSNMGSSSHVFVGLGACCFFLVMLDPLTLEIGQEDIVIRYPLWQRSIPLDSITRISLENVTDGKGNVWAGVVIERMKARRIRLFRFREGSIALNDALQAAWSTRRKM